MPRNKKQRRPNINPALHTRAPAVQMGISGNMDNNLGVLCRRCSRTLTYYNPKPGQLCTVCRKLDRNMKFPRGMGQHFPPHPSGNLDVRYANDPYFINKTLDSNIEYPRDMGQYPYSQSRSNIDTRYSDDPYLINNVNEPFYSQRYRNTEAWERRISISNGIPNTDFNAIHHQLPSQNYRSVRLKPPEDNHQFPLAPNEISFETNNETQFDSLPSTPVFQTGGTKRKLDSEDVFSKRMRPAPLVPGSRIPANDNEIQSNSLSATPVFQTGGFNNEFDSEVVFLKRTGPAPLMPDSSIPVYDKLSRSIWKYYRDNAQTDEIFGTKMALRSRVQSIIRRKFTDCELFVFGSSMTGFASNTSDVDMCLMFTDLKVQKKKAMRVLWELRTLFTRNPYLYKLQVIGARVPILKFKDSLTGFEVDLNINNPTGIRNSQLLRSYARIDERLRPLILVTKYWARSHDINDAKSGTLSSYSLGLMLIHYLQYRCHPPVLPSLQVLQPDKYLPNANVRTLNIDEELPGFRSENCQHVGDLFAGFLRYFSSEYDYINNRISVRGGSLLNRVDNQKNKDQTMRYWIDIEEPFEQVNTARSVNNPKISCYVKAVFDNSYGRLNQNSDVGSMTS